MTSPATEQALTLPSFEDIKAAAKNIEGQAVRTPLLESAALNKHLGGRILLKPETLQRTGSFKFRGAYNRISQFTEEEKSRGILAYSSGNHAQGVAAAAELCGIKATIIMPADTPVIKVENTRSYGAEVVFYDRYNEKREEVAEEILAKTQAVLVPPFDDPYIIAGQGTCGLELAQQAAEAGAELDEVLINCGGGGLSSGTALALSELSPNTKVSIVEPKDFDETARSLEAGERLFIDPEARSFCDALLSPFPGVITFALQQKLVSGAYGVSDEEVAAAMVYAFKTLKLVVEPGGAVCLAALLSGKLPTEGRTIALTLSGGNVDPALFASVLEKSA
ncbi:threonine ammonia-lyase [Rhodovibrionaceae bacterium A322]